MCFTLGVIAGAAVVALVVMFLIGWDGRDGRR